MFHVPLTYLCDFEFCTNQLARRYYMQTYAELGAKHIVLSDTLIKMVFENVGLIAEMQRDAAELGLDFVDAHAPFGARLDLCCPDKAYRKYLVAVAIHALEVCAMFGVDTITFHTGNMGAGIPVPPGATVETYVDYICESLEGLLPKAEELGIVACIENIWFPNNTPENLLKIKERFPTDALGFCYDSGHANLMSTKEQDNADNAANRAFDAVGVPRHHDDQILEKMLPHIVNCHLHDNNAINDQHQTPGHGNIDWKHVISLLRKAPRLKNIQSEVIPVARKETLAGIVAAFDKLAEM
ncbi:MAG: sugar phosphate isomerase/epimerase [Victivallales bacterium]|nr:sugar phosphate isomerase/epimerase [Victivallales bacterium]